MVIVVTTKKSMVVEGWCVKTCLWEGVEDAILKLNLTRSRQGGQLVLGN